MSNRSLGTATRALLLYASACSYIGSTRLQCWHPTSWRFIIPQKHVTSCPVRGNELAVTGHDSNRVKGRPRIIVYELSLAWSYSWMRREQRAPSYCTEVYVGSTPAITNREMLLQGRFCPYSLRIWYFGCLNQQQ